VERKGKAEVAEWGSRVQAEKKWGKRAHEGRGGLGTPKSLQSAIRGEKRPCEPHRRRRREAKPNVGVKLGGAENNQHTGRGRGRQHTPIPEEFKIGCTGCVQGKYSKKWGGRICLLNLSESRKAGRMSDKQEEGEGKKQKRINEAGRRRCTAQKDSGVGGV